jgi:uncharacterized protein
MPTPTPETPPDATPEAMPEEGGNVSVVRELYRAVETGDHAAMRRCLAKDLRWRQAGSAVPAAGEDMIGQEAAMDRVIRPIEDTWDGFSEELHELIAADGHVVTIGTYHGTHRDTGEQREAEFCHVWSVEGGLIRGFRQFTDTARFAAILGA